MERIYQVGYSNYMFYVHFLFQDGGTPLIIASRQGHIHIVKILIGNGADVNKAEGVRQWMYCW